MSETSIKQVIQGLAQSGIDIIQGVVISVNPLKIKAVKDEKLVIKEDILIIPRHLTNYKTTFSLSKGAEGSVNGPTVKGDALSDFSMNGEIILNEALRNGEVVHILELDKGKRYIVLDRV